MLDDIRNFKIDNPDAQKQMEDMLARLNVIRDRHLGPAEQGISRATKSLDDTRRQRARGGASRRRRSPTNDGASRHSRGRVRIKASAGRTERRRRMPTRRPRQPKAGEGEGESL